MAVLRGGPAWQLSTDPHRDRVHRSHHIVPPSTEDLDPHTSWVCGSGVPRIIPQSLGSPAGALSGSIILKDDTAPTPNQAAETVKWEVAGSAGWRVEAGLRCTAVDAAALPPPVALLLAYEGSAPLQVWSVWGGYPPPSFPTPHQNSSFLPLHPTPASSLPLHPTLASSLPLS